MTESDDPISLGIGAQVAATGVGVAGKLQEGKELERISKQRAAVDRANAAAAQRRAGVAAKIETEKGRRLLASQTADFAARGITVGMGSPAVVAAQTKADILKDVGFILEGGEVERQSLLSSAALEEARGKRLRRASTFDALRTGLTGGASVGFKLGETGFFDDEEDVFTRTVA